MKTFLIIGLIILGTIAGYYIWYSEPSIEEIEIGLILPLTGDLADYGAAHRDGVMMAVNEFNEKSNRLKIKVVKKDNGGGLGDTKK